MFEVFKVLTHFQLENLGSELAKHLANIASYSFQEAGFLCENLKINPFEKSCYKYSIADYIKECLFNHHTGKWLGKTLSTTL